MIAAKLTFVITGLGCHGCVAAIENVVMRLPGVAYVGVSLSEETMTIRPGPDFERGRTISVVVGLGYGVDGTTTAPILCETYSCPCQSQDKSWR